MVDKKSQLEGYEDFNPVTEVLLLLRCGFGRKDAPRLWNKLLRKVLQDLGLVPLQSDPQLFVWQVDTAKGAAPMGSHPKGFRDPHGSAVSSNRLVLILSTHVDDFKGAGEEEYRRRLIAGLEKEFSTLKLKMMLNIM